MKQYNTKRDLKSMYEAPSQELKERIHQESRTVYRRGVTCVALLLFANDETSCYNPVMVKSAVAKGE